MKTKLKEFIGNIIKWYEIDKDSKVLLLSNDEDFEKVLEEKIPETIKEIEIKEQNQKFDYIIVYGFENYREINLDLLIENNLKAEGKFVIIGENDYSINNWSKYQEKNSNNGVLKLENAEVKNSQERIIKLKLEENGFKNINTFYVFPDYKNAELIVNENLQMEANYIEKYTPDINKDEIKVFDEQKVLKEIIKNNPQMLGFFANSYFIEASREKITNDVKYVSYNNVRKTKYRLITIIREDVVEKLPENEEAKEHIEDYKKNIELFNNEVELLDYEENGKIYSKLIKNRKTLDNILYDNYKNIDEVIKMLKNFKEVLMINSIEYNESILEFLPYGFEKYKDILVDLHYLKNAFWDMVPKNCFLINNKYVFFDQEWRKEYLPVEFIMYRSIINSYDLVRNIDVNELYRKLSIEKYIDFFEFIDLEIRKEIIDEKIYKEINKNEEIKSIDNLINENRMYIENNEKQKEYIKRLEETLKDYKLDNQKKQEYIEHLERNQRKFFKRK